MKFKREDRYIVIKRTDMDKALADYPNASAKEGFRLTLQAVDVVREVRGKQPLKCVVIEDDWPEYEMTWLALEARVASAKATGYSDD